MNKKLGSSILWLGIIFMIFFSFLGGYGVLTGKYNIPVIVSFIGVSVSLVSVGISIIALSLSDESEQRMKALTNLNYYEKMAMMESYKSGFAINPVDQIKRNLLRCDYDMQAISALDPFLIDNIKKKNRSASAIEVGSYAQACYPQAVYQPYIRKIVENAKKLESEDPQNRVNM